MSTPVLRLYAVVFIAFLYLPMVVVPLFSFNDSPFVVFPLKGFTTDWYEGLLADSRMLDALRNSLTVALPVAAVSTAIGTMAAKAIVGRKLRFGGFLVATVGLPLMVPSLLMGIGLLIFLHAVLSIPLSLLTIAIGHIVICVPFATMTMMPTLQGLDPSLEEAAIDMGRTRWNAFRTVTIPLAAPGILASFLLSVTISMDEFLIAFFLSGTEATLPIYIYSELRFPERLAVLLALSTCLLMASFLLVAIAARLRTVAERRTAQAPQATP